VRNYIAILILTITSNALASEYKPLSGYSPIPLENPVFDYASVVVDTAAFNNWLNENYLNLDGKARKDTREHLYYLLSSYVSEHYKKKGYILPKTHDPVLEILFSWSERLGAYGAHVFYNKIKKASSKTMPELMKISDGVIISAQNDMYFVESADGLWSIKFPYYFMIGTINEFTPAKGKQTQLLTISTGATKDKTEAGRSQSTLVFIHSLSKDTQEFSNFWLTNFDVSPKIVPKSLGIKALESLYTHNKEAQVHKEITFLPSTNGSLMVAYIGAEGAFQTNRQHFLDFMSHVNLVNRENENTTRTYTSPLLPKATSERAVSTELAHRANIKQQSRDYFKSNNFKELEALADRLRSRSERTPSGVWKLTFFYTGMRPPAPRGIDQEGENYWKTMAENFWKGKEDKYRLWKQAYPESATANIFYAQLLVQKAWFYRGKGYAHTVSQEQWIKFFQNLNLALDHLNKIKALSSHDPAWYDIMLAVARGLGWDGREYSALLDEALEMHPYYYPIYFEAVYNLAPRWNGSLKSMDDFARRAVELTRDKEGTGMYARVYWYVSQSLYSEELFSKSLVSWPVMSQGIDDVLARYPDQWNINNFAYFACLARDRNKTNELILRIEGEENKKVWGKGDFYSQCKSWSSGFVTK